MPTRAELIQALQEFAALLEVDGANAFKVGAYDKAVRVLGDETVDIDARVQAGALTELSGIGKGISEKITEFWTTGTLVELEELRQRIPAGLVEMTAIPGFGAKKARAVFDALGVDSVASLEAAAKEGKLSGLKGFGDKTAAKILQGIALMRQHEGRVRLDVAWEAALPILESLRKHPAVQRVEVAGSLRRWREVVKDIDFVCATEKPVEVIEHFVRLASVASITGQGETKGSVRLLSGLQADLRCVSPADFPFTLAHFTGSKEHNVRMRQRAIERGMKLSEYGLFPEGSDASFEAKSEADVHKLLGLQFMAPEMREDAGEIDAAEKNALPHLIEPADLIAMVHMHTAYSDGQPSVRDYAEWAHRRGIAWMGISDHSQTAAYAGGLKPERVRDQWAEIDAVNAEWMPKGVQLLRGIESDILGDGSLDYTDDLLAGFDFVVASVHSRFNLGEDEQTARVIRAVEHPCTTILGHMTGRLLLRRDGFPVRQKEVIAACARTGTIIEINANPRRLDLDWRLVHHALDQGCLLAISPDAHDIAGLDDAKYGIAMARKGWATKEKVINCWDVKKFLAYARKKRGA